MKRVMKSDCLSVAVTKTLSSNSSKITNDGVTYQPAGICAHAGGGAPSQRVSMRSPRAARSITEGRLYHMRLLRLQPIRAHVQAVGLRGSSPHQAAQLRVLLAEEVGVDEAL